MALYSLYTHDIVRVSGPDAHKLLNDTLTCRFDDALDGLGRWFALLSPQGKIQLDGLVTHARDAYWFDLEAGLVQDFLKKMKIYRLRAKVDFDAQYAGAVWWSPDNTAPVVNADFIAYRDERSDKLGTRYITVSGAALSEEQPGDDPTVLYDRVLVEAGVPEFGPNYGRDQVFPHDVGMDFLGGVDFKKGCYVGQEVVSRMEHRGTARRRPVIVSGIDAPAGAAVVANGREAGTIGQVVDGKAVAMLRLDRFDGGEVSVGGKPVTVALPDWATYRFGESVPAD
ncbi:MAG: folate-binding protein YgfZ [Devosia nanyangense]|uniref:Folate-binding protein YgfZ n=1 Tax=Devosia nanyangense TaxID=1228055 RepID=A0A933L4W3_9HYPH|nr:folate-binding protein YgfZ [Devosia nanyangense]